MGKRQHAAQEFFTAVFEPDEQPLFVSDEATLYDIDMGDEDELQQRIKQHYGLSVTREQLATPLWQLLDYIAAQRAANTNLATVGS